LTALELRRLRPDDLDAFFACRLEALAESPEAFLTSLAEEKAKGPSRFLKTLAEGGDDLVMFGAVDGGTVVASLGLMRGDREKTRHRATINGMYVRSGYRRQGLGGRLLDLALAHARSSGGIKVVGLSLTATNDKARRLYESRGFVVWGREPWALPHGDELHMALVL
jgi:ribosomal protein S18 acetylase RimI-like enzyme